jgi:hypothetical protein
MSKNVLQKSALNDHFRTKNVSSSEGLFKNRFRCSQGDQIERIFAIWAINYPWTTLEYWICSPNFWFLYFTEYVNVHIIFDKICCGQHLGQFIEAFGRFFPKKPLVTLVAVERYKLQSFCNSFFASSFTQSSAPDRVTG